MSGKSKKVIAAGLLCLSMTTSCNSSLSPILAEIGKSFPNAGDAAVQIVLTLINLVTLPVMLIEPFLESRFTKRGIAVAGTVLMLAGGLLPQAFHSRLWMIYGASIVIGAGLSLVVVVSSSLISDYFTGIEKSRVMGFQSIFISIGGTLIAKGSGLFAVMTDWWRGYLVFFDLYSHRGGCSSDSASRRNCAKVRKERVRHLGRLDVFCSSLPDYRNFCGRL